MDDLLLETEDDVQAYRKLCMLLHTRPNLIEQLMVEAIAVGCSRHRPAPSRTMFRNNALSLIRAIKKVVADETVTWNKKE